MILGEQCSLLAWQYSIAAIGGIACSGGAGPSGGPLVAMDAMVPHLMDANFPSNLAATQWPPSCCYYER